jgi:hypothetical protein
MDWVLALKEPNRSSACFKQGKESSSTFHQTSLPSCSYFSHPDNVPQFDRNLEANLSGYVSIEPLSPFLSGVLHVAYMTLWFNVGHLCSRK